MAEKTNPIKWFQITTTDLHRAKVFYESLFDSNLRIREMGLMQMA